MSYPISRPRGEPGRPRGDRAYWELPDQVRSFFRDPVSWLYGAGFPGRSDVDIEQTEEGWVVEARLPGVAPEEVEVEVTDRELIIRARHPSEVDGSEDEDEEPAGAQRAMKAQYSQYAYRMSLPPNADPEKIDATMDHGLLVVRMPYAQVGAGRRIAVGRARPSFSAPDAAVTPDAVTGDLSRTGDAARPDGDSDATPGVAG